MKKVQDLLRLNFSDFEAPWFLQYAYRLLKDARLWPWEKDILYLLIDWLSESETMTVTTSGSTGTPKQIQLYKKHMEASARATLDFFALKAGDKALLCLPVRYIAGKMMVVRAQTGRLDLFCIEPLLAPLAELPVLDFAAMTPAQATALLETEDGSRFLNSIGKLILGGSFIPAKLDRQLQKLQTAVWHTYGMTETITHVALRRVNGNSASQWFSPLPGVAVRQAGNGCLVIDAPALGVNSLKTNDIVGISPAGFQVLGRRDNVVNSGGLKLFPEQIERKLEGAVEGLFFFTGVQDDKLGEKLVMVVEGERQPEAETRLWEMVKNRLAGYEIPKEIVFVRKIGKTQSGKIIRSLKKNTVL